MTKAEFHAMDKTPGMVLYVTAQAGTRKAAGRLVKIFKDSAVLDFTKKGIYNTVDHRFFRCEELTAVPIPKGKRATRRLFHYRCEETGAVFATIEEATAWLAGSVSGFYAAVEDGRPFKGFHFVKIGGMR